MPPEKKSGRSDENPPLRRLRGGARDIVGVEDGVQVASYKGRRPYQEDRFFVAGGLDIASVEAKKFLSDTFAKAAAVTNDAVPGSTGTAAVLTKDLKLHIAFLGDSPVAIFIRDPKTGEVEARKLTRDHHPGLADEKQRIKDAGGYITAEDRLAGVGRSSRRAFSLAVSRSFGDDGMKGLGREPEFQLEDLRPYIAAGKEVFILVSSDGLYDRSTEQDYIPTVKAAVEAGQEGDLAAFISARAHARGSSDNITALVYRVPGKLDGSLFLSVADGHGGAGTSETVRQSFAADAIARASGKPPAPR